MSGNALKRQIARKAFLWGLVLTVLYDVGSVWWAGSLAAADFGGIWLQLIVFVLAYCLAHGVLQSLELNDARLREAARTR